MKPKRDHEEDYADPESGISGGEPHADGLHGGLKWFAGWDGFSPLGMASIQGHGQQVLKLSGSASL